MRPNSPRRLTVGRRHMLFGPAVRGAAKVVGVPAVVAAYPLLTSSFEGPVVFLLLALATVWVGAVCFFLSDDCVDR